MTQPRDFDTDLQDSHSHDDEWRGIHKGKFPAMVKCSSLQREDQHLGDRVISLSIPIELDGKPLKKVFVEEKRNKTWTGEICFETNSTQEKNGWVYRPGDSHFYAFHDVQRQRVLWFPTAQLDAFWKRHGDDLIAEHGEKRNRRPTRGRYGDVWRGKFVPVPVEEVKALMSADGYELDEQDVQSALPALPYWVDYSKGHARKEEESGGPDGCLFIFIAAAAVAALGWIVNNYGHYWPACCLFIFIAAVIVGILFLVTTTTS